MRVIMDRDLLNPPFRQIVIVKVYSQEYSRIHTQLVNLIKVYATLFFRSYQFATLLLFFLFNRVILELLIRLDLRMC